MAKRVSTRGVRKHRHYTYDEAADALGVSDQTVRSWRATGLAVMAGRKPHYSLGEALIEYLADRQGKQRFKLAPDQMLCLTCRAPRRPFGMLVDYVPINAHRGRLVGLCEVCEGHCQRFASKASLGAFGQVFDIVIANDT